MAEQFTIPVDYIVSATAKNPNYEMKIKGQLIFLPNEARTLFNITGRLEISIRGLNDTFRALWTGNAKDGGIYVQMYDQLITRVLNLPKVNESMFKLPINMRYPDAPNSPPVSGKKPIKDYVLAAVLELDKSKKTDITVSSAKVFYEKNPKISLNISIWESGAGSSHGWKSHEGPVATDYIPVGSALEDNRNPPEEPEKEEEKPAEPTQTQVVDPPAQVIRPPDPSKFTSGRRLDKYYQTFSGTDMVVHMIFPDAAPIAIGECSTVTYSIYREKVPVRTLGSINPRGFTKGPRTIAGTIIFTVFQRHIVNRIRREIESYQGDGAYLKHLVKIKPDELPPFDIAISLGNEYGSSAWFGIFGITVVDEGKVFSIEDLFTENQWSYMARDVYLMDSLGHPWKPPIVHTLKKTRESGSFSLDTLILDKDYVKMQNMIADYEKSMRDLNAEALEKYKQAYEAKMNLQAQYKANQIADSMLYNPVLNAGTASGRTDAILKTAERYPELFAAAFGKITGITLETMELIAKLQNNTLFIVQLLRWSNKTDERFTVSHSA